MPILCDADRPGEVGIIRRDLECLRDRGASGRMSAVEHDRHSLVMLLGVLRAELQLTIRERDAWRRDAASCGTAAAVLGG